MKTIKLILFLVFITVNLTVLKGQITVTYDTPGNHSFIVPDGVTSVEVQLWGGGGAGGGAKARIGNPNDRSGGGGAGGTYTFSTINVTPGENISITVGDGGTGASGANGNSGGTSSFGTYASAIGGAGGIAGVNGSRRGAGAPASTGVTYNGGAGAQAPANGQSGGGGGSAGTASNGNNAIGIIGGGAVIGGGTGADGRTSIGDGSPGSTPGGGGSGAYTNIATSYSGGAGAAGQVLISYTPTTPLYCVANSTEPELYESITNVTFAGINNSSPVMKSIGYSDYSSSVTSGSVIAGQTYPISISEQFVADQYGGYCKVFIDYNQNGVFDEPDEIAFEASYTGNMTMSGNVTIPTTAASGTTRMRVVLRGAGNTGNTLPCGAFKWGEVEDYSITINSPSYCLAGSNNCTWSGSPSEHISRVEIDDIDNSSACTDGGYADYTSLSTDMEIGQNYTITVTNGASWTGDQCGIWIDWNANDSFDDDDAIVVSGGPEVFTANISPPAGALLGSVTMRIRIAYIGDLEPCGIVYWGEVEDYTINVISSCSVPSQPNPITGTATQCPSLIGQTYSIDAVSGADNYTWTIPSGWTITAGQGTTEVTVTTGSLNDDGSIEVTANNTCGSSSARTLPVVVDDTEEPVLSVASDTIYQIIDTNDAQTFVSVPMPSSSDNCGVESLLNDYNSSGNASDNYDVNAQTLITWTAEDAAENEAIAEQLIVVASAYGLEIICPSGGDLGCNPSTPAVGTPTYNDSWPWVLTDSGNDYPGTVTGGPCNFTRTIKYWAEWKIFGFIGSVKDTCEQVFTYVDDTTPPVFTTCSGNQAVNANGSGCIYTLTNTGWDAVASDNCNLVSLVHNYDGGGITLNGNTFPEGTTTVIWTATDGCGNYSECEYEITVNSISASVTLSTNNNECPELFTNQGFNPQSGSYNPGATRVVFTVEIYNSDAPEWSFDYEIKDATVRTNLTAPPFTPFYNQSGDTTVTTGNSIDLTFYIQNNPPVEVVPIIEISNIVDDFDCEHITIERDTVTIKAMPNVGDYE